MTKAKLKLRKKHNYENNYLIDIKDKLLLVCPFFLFKTTLQKFCGLDSKKLNLHIN